MNGQFIIPDGKKTGCLYRTTRVGSRFPMFGEKIEVLAASEIEDIIAARKKEGIRRRDFILEIFDQDGVGSCACEATAQALQSTKVAAGHAAELLNPWFLYYHTSGGSDRGSSIDEDLEVAADIGISTMSVWPRSKGWRDKPSDEAYASAQLNKIGEIYEVTAKAEAQTALVKGFFIQFGHDGHSELMVDLLSLNVADVANSWSTDWEDGGFHDGGFSLDRINYAYGCFAVRCTQ